MLNLNFQNGTTPALNARNMNAIVESINMLGYAVGGPNVATTVSEMTDESKVYVYTGSETGYTAGNWYYYNGSTWVSGGVYQAVAVETDTTLTMPGVAADAKATGDAVDDLKNAFGVEAKNIVSDYDSEMWEKGGLNHGQDDSYRQESRIRTKDYYVFHRGIKVKTLSSTTKVAYNIDGQGSSWLTDFVIEPGQRARLSIESEWGITPPTEMSVGDILATVQIAPVIPSLKAFEEATDAALAELDESVDLLTGNVAGIATGHFGSEMWEKGGLDQGGTDTPYRAACRVRLKDFCVLPLGMEIRARNGTTKILAYVDIDGEISSPGWQTRLAIQPNQRARVCIDCDWGNESPEMKTVDEVLDSVGMAPTQPLTPVIPGYYFANDYLPGRVDDIIANSPVDGFSFPFITDFHVRDNQCHSPAIIRYLKEQTNSVPFVIFGGDVLVSTVAEGVDVMEDAKRWQTLLGIMDKPHVYQVQGNHDYLGYHYVDGVRTLYNAPWAVCRQFVMGNLSDRDIVACPDTIAYYFDVPTANTRIIVLNDYDSPYNKPNFGGGNAFSKVQLAWVLNTALADDTKRVLFVSHQTYDPDMPGEHQERFAGIQTLFKAIANKRPYSYGTLNRDFTDSGLDFVAHFVGHMHIDDSHVDDGVLTICTTCDAIYDTEHRIAGTITEQAFDVVTVDYDSRTIKLTRIGYGSNRSFSF